MDYIGTRGEKGIPSHLAILKGLGDDGGLYVPSSFPKIDRDDVARLGKLGYAERACFVLSKFLEDYSPLDLLNYANEAYGRFEDGDPAPLIKIEDGVYMMELWHGPTLAFKDVALTMLPHLLNGARKKENSADKTLILVATSGDTGKAALEGFKDVEGTEIVVFYPSDGVSDMQKLQMQTTEGKNVRVIGIKGNFDDAQTAVKEVFADKDAKEELKKLGYSFSSANSINFGRLAPQIVYYVSAYCDLVESEEIENGAEVNFTVPSGNFGNILAAYYAKKMGIPVKKLIVASNKNNVLTDFINTGKYEVAGRDFYKTMSPSMDILVSSNLERLLFEIGGRSAEFVKDLMRGLKESGRYEIDLDDFQDKFSEFVAYSASEEETVDTIDNFFDMFDYLLDPHTAVAVSAYYNYETETGDPTPTVIVSTANPYKFPSDVYYAVEGKRIDNAEKAAEALEKLTGYEIPEAIAALKTKPVLHTEVIDKSEIKETVLNLFRK